jgi:hypothetical protein
MDTIGRSCETNGADRPRAAEMSANITLRTRNRMTALVPIRFTICSSVLTAYPRHRNSCFTQLVDRFGLVRWRVTLCPYTGLALRRIQPLRHPIIRWQNPESDDAPWGVHKRLSGLSLACATRDQRINSIVSEMQMRVLFIMALMLGASDVFAEECITTPTGRTICKHAETAATANPTAGTVTTAQKYPSGVTTAETNTGAKAAYNPNTGTAATTQKYANGVTTAQTNTGAKAAYNPNTGTAATTQKYANGVTTAQTNTGAKAAYNPNTGASAAQHTNENGVKATQTSRGGQAKTKNGMGAAEAPNGTKCYKGADTEGCKP